ncbi:MAG: diguanylate cyclase [Pseudomonadota bacterium]
MQLQDVHDYTASTFRTKSTFLITLTSLVALTPFTFSLFMAGRHLIGLGALAVVIIAALNSWEAHRGKNRPWLIVFALAPCMVAFLYFLLQRQGEAATYLIFPAIVSFYCMLDVRRAQFLNVMTLLVLTPSIWSLIEPDSAIRIIAAILAVSIFSAISSATTTRYQHALESKVVTDPLTGLFNRTLLSDTLASAMEQNQRQNTPMTLLVLDLDNFKAINDSDGHDAGDRVLIGIGEIIKQSTRISDSSFRLGGEELLCLLYGANYTNGCLVAERIRARIESTSFDTTKPTTASIGVSTLKSGEAWQHWLARGDKKLYEAKRAGKNRIA